MDTVKKGWENVWMWRVAAAVFLVLFFVSLASCHGARSEADIAATLIGELDKERDRVSEQFEDARDRADALEAENEELAGTVGELEATVAELESFIEENNVEAAVAERDDAEKKRKAAESRAESLEGDLAEAEGNLEKKDKEISGLKAQLEEKEEEIIALKNPQPPKTEKLGAGKWTAGEHIAPGRYTVRAESGSGNFIVYDSSGWLEINEILGGDWGVDDVTFTLADGDEIEIMGITVIFEEAD
ncbi:hypothetical protein JSY36_05785 [Bacillus sp. H-16]|uniref:hypothetical protein n=1 Tax=Alteribacter salitolerans TaxID=2912333 RepID=UPI001966AE8D|nr:hypothetical protein [Alteribacter salitolerans]MBM7095261.1 hypothetical protein [Alteribacter salitolerans]